MTSLHQRLNQECVHERESAVERLHLRWSSSSRVIVDRPPSQPFSRRQMSGGPISCSVKASPNDLGVGDSRRRGNASEGFQLSDSKWASSSGVITDRPPLQPLRCRGSAVGRLQQSDSRWNSGSQTNRDRPPSPARANVRMLVGPSRVSALKHSVEMKNHDIVGLNKSLEQLYLSSHNIGDDDYKSLADEGLLRMLEENQSLHRLATPVGSYASPHNEYLNDNHQKNSCSRAKAA
jgi:hypothetical protein